LQNAHVDDYEKVVFWTWLVGVHTDKESY